MKRISLLLLSLAIINSCKKEDNRCAAPMNFKTDLTQYVNPFIGTSKKGHTFPGATAPFGMVQLSPQTIYNDNAKYNTEITGYSAGYQYKDTTIIGFTHTNISRTGHSGLGDFLVMPTTGKLVLDPLKTEEKSKGFYSTFSHKSEKASPGYYKVNLDSYNIKAEFTTSERVGFHQYTFPESNNSHIILDMMYNVYLHDNKNVWTHVRVENDSLVTGYRQTNGWATTKKVFFAMQFSKPFKSYGYKKYDSIAYNSVNKKLNQKENFPEMAGKNIRAYFNFNTNKNEKVTLKFALSGVSTNGALKNLNEEIPHWDFEKTRKETKYKWNKELSKIDVKTLTENDKVTFYSALYRTNLSPILYEDIDGRYRGLDQNIYTSKDFTNYTIFSLWDTYRTLHPLFNITQPKRNNDMIKSMLAHHDQSAHNMLPVCSHYANENWCKTGYHATSVIADAIAKNVGNFNKNSALQASINTANVRYFKGLGDYIDYKYVPDDKSHYSVSKTLEYAYNDWCIAQIALEVGDVSSAEEFMKRSEYYNNVYDPKIRFMRPKLANGSFRKNFDPMDTHEQGFIVGNAWNYGLYFPHSVVKMVGMMGGKEKLTQHLDSLFSMRIEEKYFEKHESTTHDGIIGNYVHANGHGHHIPYLYNWTGHPEKTQERVRMIMDTMYRPNAEGLYGNDNFGQMSAWYIFSALGFYPVTPGSAYYSFGSPLVKEAVIHLENEKTLKIIAKNQSKENIYVKNIVVNGQVMSGTQLSHSDIVNGGEIVFEMSNTTGKK